MTWRLARGAASGIGGRRLFGAFVLEAVGLPVLTLCLAAVRPHLAFADDLLLYLAAVVGVTLMGGFLPSVVAAIASSLLLNWYFTPPLHTWTIDSPQNLFALLLFVALAVCVSSVVHLAARRAVLAAGLATEAARAQGLAEGNRIRTALLAAVGHDLRTPLASVKASVSTLRQTDVTWSPQDQVELLATIEEGADRLNGLISNLLDMSRLQTGAVQLFVRPTSLEEVAPLVVQGVDGGGLLRVEMSEDLPLFAADPGLLERALANLVANALRYSPPDQPPTLGARAVQNGNARGAVQIDVIDHGPGVPADQWQRIVKPFEQLGDPRSGNGVGLGLAVTKGFVEAMGGKLSADATPGGGLTMRIELPSKPIGLGCSKPIGLGCSKPIALGRIGCAAVTSVLVIDDEAAILRALRINLSARDYKVTTASDGASGLAAMARERPDVVILDLGLPDMAGTDVIRGIRGWSTVPIIVLSANEQELQKVQALDAGADDYVTKPFGMNELLARLRAATRRAAPGVDEPVVVTAEFTIDLGAKRVVRKDGHDIRLTPTEWQLLEVLARHGGRLVSGRQLLQDVWGPTYGTETNYLRVYMAQLRRKLEPDPARPRYLITEPGMGYRLVTD